MDYSKIKYINLHAHSDYSLQDGVGAPKEHYLETIRKGHCGCAITDHGSYASAFEIYGFSENWKKDEEIKSLFEEHKINKHPIVAGSELYIYDDRLKNKILSIVASGISKNLDNLTFIVEEASKNDKYTSLFDKTSDKFISDIMATTKRKDSNKLGEACLVGLKRILEKEEKITAYVKKMRSLKKSLIEFAEKTSSCGSYKYNHITLMAKNEIGHKNLCRLTSEAHLPKNYYMKPRIPLSRLFELKEGLIATTGCFIGMIPQAIYRSTGEENELIDLFLENFKDDFYFEIHISDISWKWKGDTREWIKEPNNAQRTVNEKLFKIIDERKLWHKSYITQDSHMPTKEDKEHQDLMILSDSNNKNGWHFHDAYYIMGIEEMHKKTKENFGDLINNDLFVQLCENSIEVLEKCRDFKIDRKTKVPNFDYKKHKVNTDNKVSEITDHKILEIENKYSNDYYVQKVIKESKVDEKLRTSLKIAIDHDKIDFHDSYQRNRFFEGVNTIQCNGYTKLVDYFMIIEKFSSIVKQEKEFKGAGRGSAAGSMASYAWDITDIRPELYDLQESRFLSKERIGLLYFDFSTQPLEEYYKSIKLEDVGLLLLQDEISKLKNDFLGAVAENKKEQLIKEADFLYHNPEIFSYLKNLKDKKFFSNENETNSLFNYLYGLTVEPIGKIKEDVGSVPDVDYDSSCRDLLLERTRQELGPECVILVGTYTSLKTKSAVDAILKTKTSLTVKEVQAVTKLFDKIKFSEEEKSKGELYIFDESVERSNEIRDFFSQKHTTGKIEQPYVDGDYLISSIRKVLGTKKNSGIHAAGAVFGDSPLIDQIPCTYDPDTNFYVAQLDKDILEKYGYVKMDALAISTGEELRDTIKRIEKSTGKDYFSKELWKLLNEGDDPEVMKSVFGKHDTLGIFQFNTSGPTDFLRRLRKDPVFIDLPLVTSIYRPGPMLDKVHEKVLRIMNGEIPPFKIHPVVDEILKDTYGEIVYQEQVMKIVQVVGGISAYNSDNIRRAMGKKKFKAIEPFKKVFIDNAEKVHGMNREEAESLWNRMAKFAEYGFNKSHAVAYARLSYMCAYFKHYHLKEWVASVMSRFSRKGSDKDKENYKKFYRKYSNLVVLPDINKSKYDYDIIDDKIYMPIFSINKIGENKANVIVDCQPYSSFRDMVLKLDRAGILNKTLVETLVFSGSCDSFRPDLSSLKKRIIEDELSSSDIDLLTKELFKNKLNDIANKLSIGIVLSEKEQELVLGLKMFSEGINIYEFRKQLLKEYYEVISLIEVNSKILDCFEDSKANELRYQLINSPSLSEQLLFKYFTEANEAERSKILALKPKSKSKKTDQASLVSEVTESYSQSIQDLTKTLKVFKDVSKETKDYQKWTAPVKDIMDMSRGKMILNELELLKITNYEFDKIMAPAIEYNKEKLLKNQRVTFISKAIKDAELKAKQINSLYLKTIDLKNELNDENYKNVIPEIVGNIIQLRNSLGEYESKDAIKEIIIPIFHSEYSDYFMLTCFCTGSSILKGLNVNKILKFKSTLSHESIKILNSCLFEQASEDSINQALELNLNYYEYGQLLATVFVINNGKNGIDLLNSTQLGETRIVEKSITFIKRANINRLNVEDYRKLCDKLGMANISVEEMERLLAIRSSVQNLPSLNEMGLYAGVVFRPDDKKNFKRERVRNGRVSYTLTFHFANSSEMIDVKVYNSETYDVNFDEKINNFHPVVLKGEIKYNPVTDSMTFYLSKNQDCCISLINDI